MAFIAYQNIELDGVQVEQASFVADTRDTFQPPMYGLRSDYEDLFAYEAALAELTARKKAAEATLDKAAIAAAEFEQFKKSDEIVAIASQLEAATKAEEKDEAKIAELTEAKEKAEAELAAIEAELAELRAPVTEIEAEIKALVKPDKVLPFVLIDRIEEHAGRAKIVNGKVLFDAEIDAAEIEAAYQAFDSNVEKRLNDFAATRRYASIYTAANYRDSPVRKYADEGAYCFRMLAETYARCEELLAEYMPAVIAGERPIPTWEEIEAQLPPLVWPDEQVTETDEPSEAVTE